MKFHYLALENINSLEGRNIIDFDKDLKGASIFLVHGPTGAGKSTILDAISLALFGTTPRLDSGVSTAKSDDELDHNDARQVMTRGKGEASVDLVFSKIREGERLYYRATWSVARARRRPDGRFQSVRRGIEEIRAEDLAQIANINPEVGSTKNKEYKAAFEDALDGLTPVDFQRSVLLAQGRFSELLLAKVEDRAKLLERMTDTTQYGVIGKRAAQRHREASDALKQINIRVESLSMLSPEERHELDTASASLRAAGSQSTEALDLASGLATMDERLGAANAKVSTAREQRERLAAAWSESEETFKALDLHDKIQPALLAKTEHTKAAAQVSKAKKDHEDSAAALAVLQAELETAQKARAAADEAVAKSKAQLAELNPQLIKAREAYLAVAAAKKREAEGSERQVSAAKELATRQAKVKEAAEQLAAHQSAAEKLALRWQELSDWHDLSAMKARLDNAAELLGSTTTKSATLDNELSTHRRLTDELSKLVAGASELEAASATLAQQRASAEEKRMSLLAELEIGEVEDVDAAIEQARAQLVELADQTKLKLDSANKFEAEWQVWLSGSPKIRAEEAEIERLTKLNAETDAQIEEIKRAQADAEVEIQELDDLRWLAQNGAAFAKARGLLKSGEPCPVCASTDHPLDAHSHQDDAQVEAALEKAVANLKGARDNLSALQKRAGELDRELVKTTGQRESSEKELARLSQEHNAAEQALTAAAEQLSLAWPVTQDAIQAVVTSLTSEQAQAADKRARLEELAREYQKADKELFELKANEGSKRQQLQDRKAQMEARESDIAEQGAKLESLRAELGEYLQELDSAFDQLPQADRPQKPEAEDAKLSPELELNKRWLEGLRLTYDAAQRVEHDRSSVDLKVKGAAQRLEDANAEQATAQAALEAAAKQLAEAAAEHREREVAAKAFFDGRAPDDVDREAQEALAAQEKALQEARANEGGLDKRVTEQRAALGRVQGVHEEAEKVLTERRAAYEQQLTALQMSEEEVLAAKLSDEAAAQLRTKRDDISASIEKNKAQLELVTAELAEVTAAFEAAQEAAPDKLKALSMLGEQLTELGEAELMEGYAAELAAAAERAAALAQQSDVAQIEQRDPGSEPQQTEQHEGGALDRMVAELKQLRDDILTLLGRLEERINADNIAKQSAADLAEQQEKARREADIWAKIHNLIGVNDGQRFVEFAQSLNLGMILQAANFHLKSFHERYELEQVIEDGLPRLDFRIKDKDMGDQARALKTLSGGETFLVSLSLALGLADMRTSTFRLETLLLDEGFGTLDSKTLSQAISALEQLQLRGYRVGLISHVTELRERIAAQVEVKPQGQGRSKLLIHS